MKLLSLLLSLILISNHSKIEEKDIIGKWLTGNKKGHVEIYKQGNKIFGKLVWLSEPLNKAGKPKVDEKNPDKARQNDPILGLNLLKNFEYEGNGVWEDGTIYDPENGKTYSCILTLQNTNTLDVRGYIGFSLIGRTDTWTKTK